MLDGPELVVCGFCKKKGYHIDLYEEKNDIGGTWHPDNNYFGLKIHTPAVTIEYFDFPLPENIDRYERITSPQVFGYLKAYCQQYDLYQFMQFNSKIEKIDYNSQTKKSKLWISVQDKKQISAEYDYVIYTHGYCNREIPQFKNMENFSGKIIHSFDCNEQFFKKNIEENKNILVLGASKSATDIILKFYDLGYKVTWVCRKPYWFFRYKRRSDWLKNKSHHHFSKTIFLTGLFLADISPKITFWLWRKFKLITTFGKPHSDFKKFHFGMLDDQQIKIIKQYYQNNAINGEIDYCENNSVVLKEGQTIKADIIICCTGSGTNQCPIALTINNQFFKTDNITEMYRSRVIPSIPNLIFTAYHQFSMGTVNGLSQGNWIAKYIELAADQNYLFKNTTTFKCPFFSSHILFNSRFNIIRQTSLMYTPFFKSKELAIGKFLKWFIQSHFNGSEPLKPLEFNLPSNSFTVMPSQDVMPAQAHRR